jgi:TPR repeat protein
MESSQKKIKQKSPSFSKLALRAIKEEKYDKYVSYLQEGIKKQNNVQCTYLLACCYFYGYCGVEVNEKKALKLFKRNVKLKHHYRSMLWLIIILNRGMVCPVNKQYANQLQEEILKSEKNHYEKGFVLDRFRNKRQEAFIEYMKVEERDGEAYLEIGNMIYFENTEFPKENSLKWFKKAINEGNVNAIEYMALWYRDVRPHKVENYKKQILWWKKYMLISKHPEYLAFALGVPVTRLITNDSVDSLINYSIGHKYYCKANSVDRFDKYWFLSWKFLIKSKEHDAFIALNDTCYTTLTRSFKATLTLLCISKYSRGIFPKDIWTLLAKYVWKTKFDEEWQE